MTSKIEVNAVVLFVQKKYFHLKSWKSILIIDFFMYLKLVFCYLHSQPPIKVLESQENQKIFLFFCLKICGFVANSHCLPLCVKNFEVLLENEENQRKNLVPKKCVSSQSHMNKSSVTKDKKDFK